MSATGRGKQDRDKNDYYPTPAWAIERFLETGLLDSCGGRWIEPCAGDGALIREVNRYRASRALSEPEWTAVEPNLAELPPHPDTAVSAASRLRHATRSDPRVVDFREFDPLERFSVSITNPSFSLAFPILMHALGMADVVVMLLRLSFLASADRHPFMSRRAPDIYILPNRPSFRFGKTDSSDYAWFGWGQPRPGPVGRLQLLNTTPLSVRRENRYIG